MSEEICERCGNKYPNDWCSFEMLWVELECNKCINFTPINRKEKPWIDRFMKFWKRLEVQK